MPFCVVDVMWFDLIWFAQNKNNISRDQLTALTIFFSISLQDLWDQTHIVTLHWVLPLVYSLIITESVLSAPNHLKPNQPVFIIWYSTMINVIALSFNVITFQCQSIFTHTHAMGNIHSLQMGWSEIWSLGIWSDLGEERNGWMKGEGKRAEKDENRRFDQ